MATRPTETTKAGKDNAKSRLSQMHFDSKQIGLLYKSETFSAYRWAFQPTSKPIGLHKQMVYQSLMALWWVKNPPYAGLTFCFRQPES